MSKLTDGTDETTSGTTGHPTRKEEGALGENPNEALDPELVKEMGADKDITLANEDAHKLEVSPEQAKAMWEGATGGATHKIRACMDAMKGKVADEGAFCQSLATKVGYKPQ